MALFQLKHRNHLCSATTPLPLPFYCYVVAATSPPKCHSRCLLRRGQPRGGTVEDWRWVLGHYRCQVVVATAATHHRWVECVLLSKWVFCLAGDRKEETATIVKWWLPPFTTVGRRAPLVRESVIQQLGLSLRDFNSVGLCLWDFSSVRYFVFKGKESARSQRITLWFSAHEIFGITL
ncbi:uncharacterized protein LOC128133211 [Lactuca sativa]|uniref:uncharacterized protein LOC128133211 n=1 Tax=Lactuca sativa TaxID=4236 RepID=UPI0022AE77B2|nr:uncharacterized protein LOC128133211 [Lactuca sativa]